MSAETAAAPALAEAVVVESPPAAPAAAPATTTAPGPTTTAFSIKETGNVARIIFSSERLNAQQLQQVLYEPTVWELNRPSQLVYADADYVHPKLFATTQLMSTVSAFKKNKKDADTQASLVAKKEASAAKKDPLAPPAPGKQVAKMRRDAATLEVVNSVLFTKLVTLFASLLDRAAANSTWIVVDRIRFIAPAAELLLECALEQTASRPPIVVIDSYQRLRQFQSDENTASIANLDKLRANSQPFPKGKSKVPAVANAQTVSRFYSHESFLDARKFSRKDVALPRTPEAAHYLPKTAVVDARMTWAYHYTQTVFGSGSHYLIYDEDDSAPDIRSLSPALAKTGIVCANGESLPWFERHKRNLLSDAPVLMLNNTGGVTQAFSSLLLAMLRSAKAQDKPKGLLKKIELVDQKQSWVTNFGMPEITLLQELNARDPAFISTVQADVLHEPSEVFLRKLMACMAGESFTASSAEGGRAAGEAAPRRSVFSFRRKKATAIAPMPEAQPEAQPPVGTAGTTVGSTDSVLNGKADGGEAQRLKKLFDLVDRDNSGAISFDEFKAGIFLMGFLEKTDEQDQNAPTEEEMRQWFDDSDADASGGMDFEEFVSLMKVEMNPKRRARVAKERGSSAVDSAPPAVPQPQPLPPLAQPDPSASLPRAADPLAPAAPLPSTTSAEGAAAVAGPASTEGGAAPGEADRSGGAVDGSVSPEVASGPRDTELSPGDAGPIKAR